MQTKSDAHVWANIIASAGLALLAMVEFASAVYAFSTGDKSITVLGVPLHATLMTAASVVVGLTAFGGLVGAAAKRGKAKRLAYAVVTVCFIWTGVNFSGYMAWSRQNAQAENFKNTYEYKEADATLAGLKGNYDLSPSEYAAKEDALEIVKAAEKPATADRTFGDLVKAAAALLLVSGMASAFQMPAVQTKAERRSRKERSDKGAKRPPRNLPLGDQKPANELQI